MLSIKIALVSGTQSRGAWTREDRVRGTRSGTCCQSRRPTGINSGRSLLKIYNGIPEYSSPDPQNIESYKSRKWLTSGSGIPAGTDRTSIRKWWCVQGWMTVEFLKLVILHVFWRWTLIQIRKGVDVIVLYVLPYWPLSPTALQPILVILVH